VSEGAVQTAVQPPGEIRWMVGIGDAAVVEVFGLPSDGVAALAQASLTPERWAAFFPVFAEPATAPTAAAVPTQPMLGRWRVQDGRPRFEPQFPLARGVRYRAEFRTASMAAEQFKLTHPGAMVKVSGATLTAYFQLPADVAPPSTIVAEIFPTADVLPENMLKFYVQFSAPMAEGAGLTHVRLLDAAGREITLPFLKIADELWDASMTRLTLFIDPGRIKRGVRPLVEVGPVFEEGKNYALVIDTAWRDAAGRPLQQAFRKEFRAGPADRTALDPARWTVRAPVAGTRTPLSIEFGESLDQALALRLLAVTTQGGESIEGEAVLGPQQRRWGFVPAQPWTKGVLQIVVPTILEDLSGNNVGKTFDVDMFEGVPKTFSTTSVRLPFEVK
jgi:hypothetical protein